MINPNVAPKFTTVPLSLIAINLPFRLKHSRSFTSLGPGGSPLRFGQWTAVNHRTRCCRRALRYGCVAPFHLAERLAPQAGAPGAPCSRITKGSPRQMSQPAGSPGEAWSLRTPADNFPGFRARTLAPHTRGRKHFAEPRKTSSNLWGRSSGLVPRSGATHLAAHPASQSLTGCISAPDRGGSTPSALPAAGLRP
jgi:hypothetical protein